MTEPKTGTTVIALKDIVQLLDFLSEVNSDDVREHLEQARYHVERALSMVPDIVDNDLLDYLDAVLRHAERIRPEFIM